MKPDTKQKIAKEGLIFLPVLILSVFFVYCDESGVALGIIFIYLITRFIIWALKTLKLSKNVIGSIKNISYFVIIVGLFFGLRLIYRNSTIAQNKTVQMSPAQDSEDNDLARMSSSQNSDSKDFYIVHAEEKESIKTLYGALISGIKDKKDCFDIISYERYKFREDFKYAECIPENDEIRSMISLRPVNQSYCIVQTQKKVNGLNIFIWAHGKESTTDLSVDVASGLISMLKKENKKGIVTCIYPNGKKIEYFNNLNDSISILDALKKGANPRVSNSTSRIKVSSMVVEDIGGG